MQCSQRVELSLLMRLVSTESAPDGDGQPPSASWPSFANGLPTVSVHSNAPVCSGNVNANVDRVSTMMVDVLAFKPGYQCTWSGTRVQTFTGGLSVRKNANSFLLHE